LAKLLGSSCGPDLKVYTYRYAGNGPGTVKLFWDAWAKGWTRLREADDYRGDHREFLA
jgi:hypothetical protein